MPLEALPGDLVCRLRAAGARPGDRVIRGMATREDARLAPSLAQRAWVERLLPCLEGMHAQVEAGQRELFVACAESAVSGVLATLLEQGFVAVRLHPVPLPATDA